MQNICFWQNIGFAPQMPLKESKPLGTRPMRTSLRPAPSMPLKVEIHKMAPWEQPPPFGLGSTLLECRSFLPLSQQRRDTTALPAQPPGTVQLLGRVSRLNLRAAHVPHQVPPPPVLRPSLRATCGSSGAHIRSQVAPLRCTNGPHWQSVVLSGNHSDTPLPLHGAHIRVIAHARPPKPRSEKQSSDGNAMRKPRRRHRHTARGPTRTSDTRNPRVPQPPTTTPTNIPILPKPLHLIPDEWHYFSRVLDTGGVSTGSIYRGGKVDHFLEKLFKYLTRRVNSLIL